MIRVPTTIYRRNGIFKRAVILICFIFVIITVIYNQWDTFSQEQPFHRQERNDDTIDINWEASEAYSNSIFMDLHKSVYEGGKDKKEQIVFESLSKIDQCIMLVKASIRQWDQTQNDPDDSLFLLTEQLRVYDYCFISGGLELSSVFNHLEDSSFTPTDYNQKLFPYLNSYEFVNKPMVPSIYRITKNGKQEITPIKQINDIKGFNENFWSSWLNYSSFKGIVVTMSQDDVDMFKKLLSILNFLDSNLPIQIVTTGNDFNEDMISILSQIVKENDQEIYLVDCSKVINKAYIHDHITGFLNKWVATLFNNLEEIILLDIDSVPFISPIEFFNIKQYKQSGMYIYRDREILKDGSPQTCLEQFRSFLPSAQEISLNMAHFKFEWPLPNVNDKSLFKDNKNQLTMEERVFQDFFQLGNMHQVDSGLVVIDRRKQLGGLLVAFALHLSQEFEKCIHGDKEFFWLGPLIAGKDYSIDPTYAGTIGMLYETEEHGSGICATQITHANEQDKLQWVNGGLNICKFKDAADNDFQVNPSFFKDRYNDLESLQAIYDSPLQMDAIVIPDVDDSQWMQTRECTQYRYCAYFNESKSTQPNTAGRVIRLTPGQIERYNRISSLWSQA